MKKIVCLLLTILLMAACAAFAEEEEQVVRVSGNATVTLAADYVTLQIGVSTRLESVTEAQEENAWVMQAVLAAVLEAGVAEKDAVTSQFNVNGSWDVTYDAQGREQRTFYYQVENILSVTVRDLDKIGMVLDAAMAAGANTMYGITFASLEENEAYQKALTRAVQDAMQKAQVLCSAAGKELGELVSMDASQGTYNYGLRNVYSAKADRAAGTAIVSGDVSVSASVVLTYRFR